MGEKKEINISEIIKNDNAYIKEVIEKSKNDSIASNELIEIIKALLNYYKQDYGIIDIEEIWKLFKFDNWNLMWVFWEWKYNINIDGNIWYIESIKVITDYYRNAWFETIDGDDILTHIYFSENLENLDNWELDRDEMDILICDLLNDVFNHLIFD